MRLFRSKRLIHGFIAALVLVLVMALFLEERAGYIRPTLTSWEYRFRDEVASTGRFNPPDQRLLFLGIDSASVSLSQLDLDTLFADAPPGSPEARALMLMAAGWPWSREVYALLADRLIDAGARAIVFDLLFPKSANGDDALQSAFAKYPDKLAVGSNFVSENIGGGREAWSITLPVSTIVPDARPNHPAIGYVNFWPGQNGVVRSAQYHATLEQLEGIASPPADVTEAASALAFRAAAKLANPKLSDPYASHLLRFSGAPGTFTPIPLYQIFAPRYWQQNFGGGAALRDKIVLVGPAGNWAHDEHSTPLGQMPGPELQLNSINALLHDAFLREIPPWANYGLLLLAAILAWLITVFVRKTWVRLGTFVLLGAGYLLSVKLAYDHVNTIVLAIPPVLAFAVSGLGSFIYDYTHETLEKLRIRRTLESYVSRDVVREVLDNPASYLHSLGGKRTSVAIIVTDLRGFTTMSEQMESSQLVTQLNEYLSLMVEDIFACRGSIDKFIGDAILAAWGHVNSDGPAADVVHAVEAALRMKTTLARLNAEWRQRGMQPFAMGCGLNFGEVIFGNIGSAQKMEPTVIGDTVNITSRLEGLTKDYGRDLLVGEAAADLIRDTYTLQLVDRVVLQGKTRPLKIYGVLGRADVPLDGKTARYLEIYNEAQEAYREGKFDIAATAFGACAEYAPNDPLPEIYADRCRELMASPPETEWAGIHVAAHK